MQTPLENALSFASNGIPVFPCRSTAEEDVDPRTGEVFTRSEKSPLTCNGLKAATKFERIIRRWWADNPDAMIGAPTGALSGFFVLDLDVKETADGHDWLAEQERLHGALPDTTRVRTANGGTHIWFRHVEGVRNRGGLGAGVDIRGDGGYVIMPGSRMADGRSYDYLSQDRIADAPQWLLDMLLPQAVQHAAEPFSYRSGTNDRYVNAAVDSELADLAATGKGNRGYQLNASAFAIGQIVASGALSRTDAESGLYDAAVSNGLVATDGEREVWAKIRRGIDAGMKQPRDIPEPQEDNTRLIDITRMIENGLSKAAGKHEQSASDVPANDNVPDGPIRATAFEWIDPRTIPRREFAFGNHFIRKYVSVTVSPGGIGKTSASIAETVSMVSGRDLLGIKPDKRLRVWMFNAEDPRDEMERRIMAACLHYKLGPSDISGHLFLDTGREQELVVAIEDKKSGVRIQSPIVEAVVDQIHRHSIDVMIIDPFVSTHSVNENDNGAIDKVAKLWAHIADRTNCAIDIVHHLRKVADREATVEDARGAVSLIGAARSVRVLNRMSADQANAAGVAENDRYGYFSINYGKSNLTPLNSRLSWRRLVSVPLGNGAGLGKPQDHAPVVTEWQWPSSETLLDSVTDDQRQAICVAVDNADYKLSQKAKNWAGLAVAYVLGLDADDDAQRKRAGAILKALVSEGILVEREGRDPVRREVSKFVRAA